ncbi:hypothetical protein CT0861_03256 [Colletotrichum tofieldiae]|uniref:Uncharacterized protein n=1 Tax=Colletotrichum tofieldiae TaxID=708197 RepID=A0A166PSQ8_9PEZI|nr:hypothetical protein CT0861_03256 [Colletotrichum tofieldiae]
MASRISIPNLLTPDLAMHTVPAEAKVRSDNAYRPQTPPQRDISLSTNGICYQTDVLMPDLTMHTVPAEAEVRSDNASRPQTPPQKGMSLLTNDTRHQTDVEPCSVTTSHATAVHSLLSPAKLTSSGQPTLKDMFSVQMLQPSTVTSSSLALQQQMFDGYGSLGPPDYSVQMLPTCCCNSFINFPFFESLCDQQLLDISSLGNYDPAFLSPTCNYYGGWHFDYASGVCDPLENGASSSYFMESPLPEAYLTGACLGSVVSVHDTPVELIQPWTYGLDGQPVPQ